MYIYSDREVSLDRLRAAGRYIYVHIRCVHARTHFTCFYRWNSIVWRCHINITLLTVIGWFSIEKWLSVFGVGSAMRSASVCLCRVRAPSGTGNAHFGADIFAIIFGSMFMLLSLLFFLFRWNAIIYYHYMLWVFLYVLATYFVWVVDSDEFTESGMMPK